MNTGYTAALITLCCWTISTFILAKLSRLVLPGLLNKVSLFFSIFLLGIVVCAIDKINPLQLFTTPNFSNWLWLGLSGIIGKTLGDYCGFACLRIMGPRRRSMLTTLTPGFAWIIGLLMLQEHINAWGIGAIFLTIISLLLLLHNQSEKEEVKQENFGGFRRGALMGLLGAALTALAFIFSKKTFVETGHHISEFHGTWIRIIVAFAALWLTDWVQNKNQNFIGEIIKSRQKSVLLFFAILFSSILGLSFSLMAITRMEVAVAYTIFSLVPLAVLLVSVIVLRKKLSWINWLWSLLAIAGAIILVWSKRSA